MEQPLAYSEVIEAFCDEKAPRETQLQQLIDLQLEIAGVLRNADPQTRVALKDIPEGVVERMAWAAIRKLAKYA